MVALLFAVTVYNKSEMNSVHIFQFYLFKPHCNIIISSVPSLPSGTFASGFQTKPLYTYVFTSMQAASLPVLFCFQILMHNLQIYESVNAVQ